MLNPLKRPLIGLLAVTLLFGATLAWAADKPDQKNQPAQPAADKAAAPCTDKSGEAKPCPSTAKPCPMADKECPRSAPMSKLVLPGADTSPFLTEEDFVMNWAVLGPFKFGADEFGGEHQQAAADKAFMPNEAGLMGCEAAPEGTKWQVKQFTGNLQPGQVDLEALYSGIDHAAVYAVACLQSPKAIDDASIWTGSDDYITVWVNGQQVLKYNEKRRGSDWDQDVAEHVKLKEGCNRVVVKVTDVVGGYDFYFRLTDKDGNPIAVQPVEQKKSEATAAKEPAAAPAQERAKEPEGSPEE